MAAAPQSDAPRYDIIIPHFGIADTPAYAVRCLQTIRQYSRQYRQYRIILVDNGGDV